MMSLIPFNTLIQALLALWITLMFTQWFQKGGWHNGLRFGLYLGVLCGIQAAGAYYYLPIPAFLAAYWFSAHVIESLVGGFLTGLIYRQ